MTPAAWVEYAAAALARERERQPKWWPSQLPEPCGHATRRKRGHGEDGAIAIDAWECVECGQLLVERAGHGGSHR